MTAKLCRNGLVIWKKYLIPLELSPLQRKWIINIHVLPHNKVVIIINRMTAELFEDCLVTWIFFNTPGFHINRRKWSERCSIVRQQWGGGCLFSVEVLWLYKPTYEEQRGVVKHVYFFLLCTWSEYLECMSIYSNLVKWENNVTKTLCYHTKNAAPLW